MDALWTQYRRVIKPNGAIVLTAQGLFSARLMLAASDIYKYSLVWRKNKPRGHMNAKKQPLRNHEDILVFYARQPTYNPRMTQGHDPMHAATNKPSGVGNYGAQKGSTNNRGSTERYPLSVIDIPVLNNDDPLRVHPTQKPVQLGEYLIATYTNAGDTVLDNCAGSGAFLVAAKNLGRHYVGIEADNTYVTHARNWLGVDERTPLQKALDDDDRVDRRSASQFESSEDPGRGDTDTNLPKNSKDPAKENE